jgi:hypothetical protein
MTLKLTYEQKLYSRLSSIRRKSGPLQALASEECDVLRKIVAVLQFKLENTKDSANAAQRKVRRLEKLVALYKGISYEQRDEISRLKESLNREFGPLITEVIFEGRAPKKFAPSTPKGLDL